MTSFLPKLVAFVVLLLAAQTFADTGSVTLAWNANSEPDVSGYKLYWGTASGVYARYDDTHHQLTTTVRNLRKI